MLHLRNWQGRVPKIKTAFTTFVLLGLIVVLIISDASWTQVLQQEQYDQYVQWKRAIAEMELWQGEVPMSVLQTDKNINKAWIGGDTETAISLLNQALTMVETGKRWSMFGNGPIDKVPEATDLLTIVVNKDRIVIEPTTPKITLTTGVVKLCRVTVVNQTNTTETVNIDAPELFRAGRTFSLAPDETSHIVWLFRTLEVFPFQAMLNIKTENNKQSFPISVTPEVNYKKPLLGFSIHIPNYGRYNRVRPGGKQKPSPEQMKNHPELFRPTHLEKVSPDLEEQVRMHYLSLRSQPSQIYRVPGDWDFVELQRDRYSWEYVDANINDLRDLTKTIPVLYLGYQPWWVLEARNSNGKKGFKDIRNQDLMNKYRQYIRTIAEHTWSSVPIYELWNEPALYWFYDETTVPSGRQYISEYGDLLKTVINISVDEISKAAPESWIISPGFVDPDMVPAEWTMVKYLLNQKSFDRLDALCIHKYPFGVDAAPPPGKSFYPWIDLDHRTDESALLKILQDNGKSDMPLWCTEAGGFGNGRLDGLADLHVGSIMAHQGFCGLHFTSLPVTLNLLSEAVTGATPVEWGPCKQTDSDYSGVVIKMFTRGPEDIIILWNNSDQLHSITFTPSQSGNTPELLMVQEISEPLGGPARRYITMTPEDLSRFFQKPVKIEQMEWIALLIVPASGTGFEWLSQINGVGPDPNLADAETLWKQVRTFRREIFSGEIGSLNDQRALKQGFGAFVKAWDSGRISEAKSVLQDMVNTGRGLGK